MTNTFLDYLQSKYRILGLKPQKVNTWWQYHYGDLGERLFREKAEEQKLQHIHYDLNLLADNFTQIDALVQQADHLIFINVKYYQYDNRGQLQDYYSSKIKTQLDRSRMILDYILQSEGI